MSNHPSLAICLDVNEYIIAHDACIRRYGDISSEEILWVMGAKLRDRPTMPKTCLPTCTWTPRLIIEEPANEEPKEKLKRHAAKRREKTVAEEAARRRAKLL